MIRRGRSKDVPTEYECCTYALKCPITGIIRYIGRTHHLERRIREHLNMANKNVCSNRNVSKWIAQLRIYGLSPIYEIICYEDKELYYVDYYSKKGRNAKLLNASDFKWQVYIDDIPFFHEYFKNIKEGLKYKKHR